MMYLIPYSSFAQETILIVKKKSIISRLIFKYLRTFKIFIEKIKTLQIFAL